MNELLNIAFALLAGLLMTRVMKRLHLPDVTAYLIAGLLIGPCFLGRLAIPGIGFASYEELDALTLISNVALGFIAFSIGGEFKLRHIRQIGKSVITITFLQALMATLLVDVVLIIAGFPTPVCLTLGAIATATAPAATLMVVRQYKAKGLSLIHI